PRASGPGWTPATRAEWTTWRARGPSGRTPGDCCPGAAPAGRRRARACRARPRAGRQAPGRLRPGCRAVVSLALAYVPREDDPSWSSVSRYARGGDYHELMRPRPAALVASVRG